MGKLKAWAIAVVLLSATASSLYSSHEIRDFMHKGGRFTQEEGDALEGRIRALESFHADP